MDSGPIDYGKLIREGLRSVMARSLKHTLEHGLYGDQHFYITYYTQHSGVVMPDSLRAQFPEEITIVLEYEFEELAVMDDRFSVELSFGGKPTLLVVPFAAVSMFRDPSVNFQIEFPFSDEDMALLPNTEGVDSPAAPESDVKMEQANMPQGDPANRVVSLDAFRKK